MTKIFKTGICLLLVMAVMTGCGCEKTPSGDEEPTEIMTEAATGDMMGLVQDLLPFEDSIEMIYSSGVGGWETQITLTKDGRFSGNYYDSEMGNMGEEYPNGTCYVSRFEGKFKDIKLEDDGTFSMVLDYVENSKEPGEEWIEDGVRYVSSGAWGIAEGERFLFYTPDTPISSLNTDFVFWWHGDEENEEVLNCYGLYNTATGAGFFTY